MEKQYEMMWSNKWLTSEAKTIEDMIRMLRGAADELQELCNVGVTLSDHGSTEDDHAMLVTSDPLVALAHGMMQMGLLEED